MSTSTCLPRLISSCRLAQRAFIRPHVPSMLALRASVRCRNQPHRCIPPKLPTLHQHCIHRVPPNRILPSLMCSASAEWGIYELRNVISRPSCRFSCMFCPFRPCIPPQCNLNFCAIRLQLTSDTSLLNPTFCARTDDLALRVSFSSTCSAVQPHRLTHSRHRAALFNVDERCPRLCCQWSAGLVTVTRGLVLVCAVERASMLLLCRVYFEPH